jgi:hypothetical protein
MATTAAGPYGLTAMRLENFSGLNTLVDPTNLPPFASPDCPDVEFFPGVVQTRPPLVSQFSVIAGNPSINYLKTYITPSAVLRMMALDSLGTLWEENPQGILLNVGAIETPGAYAGSTTLFGREYIAVNDGRFGIGIPRQFDDVYFDRVSQGGPGAPPTVVDGAAGNIPAGVHQLVVIFVTRQGYLTAPSPPVSWTAAGAKVASLTNIATGPPNVIARILAFTGAGGNSFFYVDPADLTLPASLMVIHDNVTTTATIDFTDQILLSGNNVDSLFRLIELGGCAQVTQYSSRLFWCGERNKQTDSPLARGAESGGTFVNLEFDGGYGGIPTSTNTGVGSPSTAINFPPLISTLWTNPGNVFAADGVVATCSMIASGGSDNLFVSGYGFAVPANAIINGIVVKALVRSSLGTVRDLSVFIMKAGTAVGTDHFNGNPWTTVLANQTYGSTSDLWGATWTPADINNAGFGFVISATNNSGSAQVASIDYISIQVYYTVPSASTVPLGWTAGASVAGGGSALTNMFPVVWGDAYSITGDGATAVRGQITQSAYQSYLKIPIISRNTSYSVRARLAKAGGLTQGVIHINLQSTSGAFTTSGLSAQVSQLTNTYQEFTGTLTSAIIAPPSDLLLQIYADGTPNNGGVFLIDCIEIYPTNFPNNLSLVRASFAGQPEAYDGITGFLSVAENNGQAVKCSFVLRDFLYFAKERSLYVTQDNGGEPSTWSINEVSGKIGTPSPRGVGIGDEWAVIGSRDGLYHFNGSLSAAWSGNEAGSKLSNEIQPTWDSINWNVGYLLAVTVDTQRKRIYIAVPIGAATIPNKMLVLDYIEGFGDPLAQDGVGRKWSIWNIPCNSMALIERFDGTQKLFIGNNTSTGKILQLTPGSAYSDDGASINGYWQSGFFQDKGRLTFGYISANVVGNGTANLTLRRGDQNNLKAVRGWNLVPNGFKNQERQIQVERERMAIVIGANAVGSFFSLQGLSMYMKPSTWSPVRGMNG